MVMECKILTYPGVRENYYSISNNGVIVNIHLNRELPGHIKVVDGVLGYYVYPLKNELRHGVKPKSTTILLARLVAMHFLPFPEGCNSQEELIKLWNVAYKDGNWMNVHASNLFWVKDEENFKIHRTNTYAFADPKYYDAIGKLIDSGATDADIRDSFKVPRNIDNRREYSKWQQRIRKVRILKGIPNPKK